MILIHIISTIKIHINTYQTKLPSLVIEKITQCLPTIKINENNLHIPHNLDSIDPSYYILGDIDLLVIRLERPFFGSF